MRAIAVFDNRGRAQSDTLRAARHPNEITA